MAVTPTVRLRLTLLYGGMFLACGAALLALTYVLVQQATDGIIFSNQNSSAVVTGKDARGDGSSSSNNDGQSDGQNGGPAPVTLSPQQATRLAREQHDAELHRLLLQSGIALAAMTVVSIGVGWFLAGRVLRPLRTITATVQDISATDLDRRLALAGPEDELKALGDTFDGLLARLEAAFTAQRQFVANASHELRTPLARQRVLSQVAIDDPEADPDSLREAHERVLSANREQERIIDGLLALARGQAGPTTGTTVDLAEIAARAIDLYDDDRAAAGIAIHSELHSAPLEADPTLLEHLVRNLVSNAVLHNTQDGEVWVFTRTIEDRARIRVTNTGSPIPPSEVDGLFLPFRRGAPDRVTHRDGAGLGLSVVKAIADAHGADITARAPNGGGLEVTVDFR
jgi:signal transduction histidine kinase